MFEGGLGSEWVKESVKNYMKEHKNITIKLTASPDIHQQLQTRFLSDDVPDLISPGPNFDIMGVLNEGKLMQLDDVLQEEAYGSKEKWLDTFESGQFNLKKDNKTYGIPTVFSAGYLWWYDEKLFNDNGWGKPETMEDLYKLGKQAKEKGISLFAVPGKYPGYYFYGIFIPLVERYGGKNALLDAFNLKENAWKSDSFLNAAKESKKMVDKGMFMEGTFGLSHTEAQTLFFQRKALFATAGTWLEGEMADIIPADFKLRAMNQPSIVGGKGESLAPVSTGWGGGWYISESSKNKKETVDFLKYLSSKEQVSAMIKSKGAASVVKGTEEAIESEALKSALKVLQDAKGSYAPTALNDAYPELINNIINVYQSLMLGEIKPEEFVNQAQKFADQANKDNNLEKVEFKW
ncbi:extracellular solute-binding protein [Bacillus testis]|uniref:extracellular solute-binding protein n=1 Tax=Bacillus testis TaxID=1622072 RepID=UPI0021C46FA2|nr:extracellular solute-binding protein [Bacillus testis]